MARFFSPSTRGFFSEAIHGARQIPDPQQPEPPNGNGKRKQRLPKPPPMIDNPDCTIPPDAVEVSDAEFDALFAAQQEGLAIVIENGRPALAEREIDPADFAAINRVKRNRLLAASDWTQLPDAPLDKAAKAAWRDWRAALRALDVDALLTVYDWPPAPGAIEGDD